MFFYTFKANKKAIIGAALIVAALVVLSFAIPSRPKTADTAAQVSLQAKTNAERLAFIRHFGYDVTNEPVETKFVVIPEQFDDTYLAYNELQQQQGFDLSKLKGKTVKSYSYAVANYPGVEQSEKTIRANLLVDGERIVAADICSVELAGFMHALVNNEATQSG